MYCIIYVGLGVVGQHGSKQDWITSERGMHKGYFPAKKEGFLTIVDIKVDDKECFEWRTGTRLTTDSNVLLSPRSDVPIRIQHPNTVRTRGLCIRRK